MIAPQTNIWMGFQSLLGEHIKSLPRHALRPAEEKLFGLRISHRCVQKKTLDRVMKKKVLMRMDALSSVSQEGHQVLDPDPAAV